MMGRNRKLKASKVTTVIGQGTEITGDIRFTDGLHLDGVIKGDITGSEGSRSTLTISEAGSVEGDVRVDNLILNGSIKGDVFANERVELAPHAKVTGTVYYRLLEMAMGAEVNGQLVHSEEKEPRMLSYDGAEQQTGRPVTENQG